MNTRRTAGVDIVGADAGVNKVPPQLPAAGMDMSVNPIGLTYGEIRTTLVKMAKAIN